MFGFMAGQQNGLVTCVECRGEKSMHACGL
jgi:hypothetical protein